MRLRDSLARAGDTSQENSLRLEINSLKTRLEEARRSRADQIGSFELRIREKDRNLEVVKSSNKNSLSSAEQRLQQILSESLFITNLNICEWGW